MRSSFLAIFLALTATLVLTGAALAAQAPRDMLIVPGVRVGPIALGMNPEQMAASAGVAGAVQHQGPDTIYSWGDVAARIGDKSPNVDVISVNDPRYETAGHVHVGLAALAALAVLGDPTMTTTAPGIQNLEYDGMIVVVRNNLVAQIRVRK